jgi:hypothetical protein
MVKNRCISVFVVAIIALTPCPGLAGGPLARQEAARALRKAVEFFHSKVSCQGGYLWRYSGDLALREGEGKASPTMVWVQPPGTPTVGQACLDAYEATGDEFYLGVARDAAYALVRGQLRSGGWYYHIEFDPERRLSYGYRGVPERRRQNQKTTLDDDTTQSAVRFLMHVDKTLQFKDAKIHEACDYALRSMLGAQYPNGAWYQWWDSYPSPASAEAYPVLKASYPRSWSRQWLNDWTGCYFINDNLAANMIATMLEAYEIYDDDRYLASALKAGDFLLLAQMPDPQPAWAQQYDPNMHPVWDRKFEPPAISGLESQGLCDALMLLYTKTGKKKYLVPIPRAIEYLRSSQLSEGKLARFYELQTNRPLYFTKDYKLTYDGGDVPTHYSFVVDSRLNQIEARYRDLLAADPNTLNAEKPQKTGSLTPALIAQTRKVIDGMDERGAWVERGCLSAHKVEPASGVIDSRTFVNNIGRLCRYLNAAEQD